MDAKDRLRLYLEQRRELGESELVLDALPVDDVLRMLGAPKSRNDAQNISASTAQPPVATPAVDTPVSVKPAERTVTERTHAASTEAMQSSGDGAVVEQPANAAQSTQDSALPTRYAPPEQPTSTTSPAHSNWREMLQQPNANASTAPIPHAPRPIANTPLWLTALDVPLGLVAAPLRNAVTSAAVANAHDLSEVASVIAGCRACPLFATALNPVPGEGHATADFVCVGEAPGQTEDETGRPFVGAAGQLLTKILGAIQLQRDDVFICNVLKHRPPGNRNPLPDEVTACTPYLTRQLELLKPKVILALGTFAAQTLLNTVTALGKLRGQVHSYQGIPLVVTYHPAALLRNESWKRPAWDDVKLARRVLDAARAADAPTN